MSKKIPHLETVQFACPEVVHTTEFGVDFLRAISDDSVQEKLNSEIRKQVAQKIRTLKKIIKENGSEVLTQLMSCIDDPHPKVRLLVARALEKFLVKQVENPSPHIQYALQHLENDHETEVRSCALEINRKFKIAQRKHRYALQGITIINLKETSPEAAFLGRPQGKKSG